MIKYIGDSKVILSLQGLRYIEKIDEKYATREDLTYKIKYGYKTCDRSITYETKRERDQMFVRLLKALTENKNANIGGIKDEGVPGRDL